MCFLLEFDSWREENSGNFWDRVYDTAPQSHKKQINAMTGLTRREATQKLYKCDETSASHHSIPVRWNTSIIRKMIETSVMQIIGSDTMHGLLAAKESDPQMFDEEIEKRTLLLKFLAGPRDIEGGDKSFWKR